MLALPQPDRNPDRTRGVHHAVLGAREQAVLPRPIPTRTPTPDPHPPLHPSPQLTLPGLPLLVPTPNGQHPSAPTATGSSYRNPSLTLALPLTLPLPPNRYPLTLPPLPGFIMQPAARGRLLQWYEMTEKISPNPNPNPNPCPNPNQVRDDRRLTLTLTLTLTLALPPNPSLSLTLTLFLPNPNPTRYEMIGVFMAMACCRRRRSSRSRSARFGRLVPGRRRRRPRGLRRRGALPAAQSDA